VSVSEPLARSPFIVVGVDGSPHSAAALRWALGEAELRRAEVHVLHAWTVPPIRSGIGQMSPIAGPPESYRSAAEAVLTSAVEEAVREGAVQGLVLTRTLIQRAPAAGLVLAAQGAELLVVGRRRGASRLMRPASIRHGCIDQASCPVVVVP